MPLALVLWQQLLIVGITVAIIAACWVVVLLNEFYDGWWDQTLYFIRCVIYRVRYGKVLRRIDHGQCPTCGYNLRGNLSGFCPECGAEIEFVTERIIPAIGHNENN
jgi:hypothetical protein